MPDNLPREKSNFAKREEDVLSFWKESNIFKKSLEKEAPNGEFIFYEGPPTANGKPGIHHLAPRAFKDVVLRYKTMRGYHVRRKGGWDTHGLPVELQVEKELGLKSKKEIEEYGVAEFNKKCKESVWQYIDLWEKFTDRIGYWVDQEHPYITYETPYIESLWNIFKKVEEQKLLYKDYKVVPWCPRCGTGLSSHELAQGYQDVKDLSVYVKFKIVGEENTYFLAWTTTPWTLPGNVALAVGEKISYVKVKTQNENLVLAKDKLSLLGEEYEILGEMKGMDIIGLSYESLYPFIKNKIEIPGLENAFKVYGADFVNTEDGTGIVHTAVMYGQDDFELGTKAGLPKYHVVSEDGHFKEGLDFLSGRFVKDEETTVEIIKDLAHRGLLFKKEKYEHSYPHCWRCKTPLIYYARDSWYIRISELRDRLVKENEGINWEPSYFKEGRFGEWLRDVKDWAISRERYWGTPLPIWQKQNGEYVVIGSLEELRAYTKSSGNHYFVMRHGEADHNIAGIISSKKQEDIHITSVGREQVKKEAENLKKEGIELILVSPFERCRETAEILGKELGISEKEIIIEDRISELNVGELDGLPIDEFYNVFGNTHDRFTKQVAGGETLLDLQKRVTEFLYDIDKRYSNKKILIVSHQAVITALHTVSHAVTLSGMIRMKDSAEWRPDVGEVKKLDFWRMPRNENFEIDLHRPYIDDLELVDENGGKMTRVKEVADVWFDSGAMPFAQDHYPFENREWTEGIGYPADYISEAIDQTRGWFYTLHAIGVLMGRGRAYKNVVCLGHILDKEGKKMSKSIGNVVDPWLMADTYGIDALRFWMYSVNQPGESKNFDERSVDEIVKKVFNLILNSTIFYELQAGERDMEPSSKSPHVLDRWVLSRLGELVESGEKYLDSYKIFEACRNIRDFADDFSTWYVRRSRDRFKSGDEQDRENALSTMRFVLRELSKYMAPFTPFFAEDIYQKMKTSEDPESVHLAPWSLYKEKDETVLADMKVVRDVVSEVLRLRADAGIKVRQPLARLSITQKLDPEFTALIAEEVNVKEVYIGTESLVLGTEITDQLKKEGRVRDIIRFIQEERKKNNFVQSDLVSATFDTGKELKEIIEEFEDAIKKETGLKEISFKELSSEKRKIDDLEIGIFLVK